MIEETKTRWTHCSHFRNDHLCQGWETARVKFTEICALDTISLRAKVYLVDVYDGHSNLVTKDFLEDVRPLADDCPFIVGE